MAVSRGRSIAASIIGWVVAALIVYFIFGWVIGTIRWILRVVVVLVVIGAMLALYFKLRGDDGRSDE